MTGGPRGGYFFICVFLHSPENWVFPGTPELTPSPQKPPKTPKNPQKPENSTIKLMEETQKEGGPPPPPPFWLSAGRLLIDRLGGHILGVGGPKTGVFSTGANRSGTPPISAPARYKHPPVPCRYNLYRVGTKWGFLGDFRGFPFW